MHLDKGWLGSRVQNVSGTHREAIDAMARVKRDFTPEDVRARAEHVIRRAVASGTTAIRTHVDVDSAIGLLSLDVLRDLGHSLRDLVDLQLVPTTRAEIVESSAARRLIEEALRGGVDALGGTPRLDALGRRHLEMVFELARAYDVDIDLHVDETDDPDHLLIADLILLTQRARYAGRVTAGHLCSLGAVGPEAATPIIAGIKAAGINVVTLPSANLFLQGRSDERCVRRGLTRVRELLAAGVNVAVASDNVRDAFCPFGNADLLQAALLLAHAAHMGSPADLEAIARMITENPARIFWRTTPRRIAVGQPADLVLCNCTTPAELILSQPTRLVVFKSGRPVARTEHAVTFTREQARTEPTPH
jgi:cytosine deaminase